MASVWSRKRPFDSLPVRCSRCGHVTSGHGSNVMYLQVYSQRLSQVDRASGMMARFVYYVAFQNITRGLLSNARSDGSDR